MRHHKAEAWEQRLRAVFDRIDAELEARYGDRYPLHPARPEHGTTANPAHSGLFRLGGAFTAGFGSAHGPGYVVQVGMATLSHVPPEVQKQMEEQVVSRLREELPRAFPGRALHVSRDGHTFKIHGDLSLGVA